MTSTISSDHPSPAPPEPHTINVTVRFAAAPKPFQDHDARRDETLGLVEGQSTPDGNTVTYKLYHGKAELTDLSATLGSLAEQAHALELKLSQFVQQGAQR